MSDDDGMLPRSWATLTEVQIDKSGTQLSNASKVNRRLNPVQVPKLLRDKPDEPQNQVDSLRFSPQTTPEKPKLNVITEQYGARYFLSGGLTE